MRRVLWIASCLFALGGFNCAPTTAAPPAQSAPAVTPPAVAPATSVARVVFLDRENACDCTRTRAEGSWRALQAGLAGLNVPVERIHADTQTPEARGYLAMRPMMVIPGVYFLTAQGQLREMLQGDVTEAQVRAVLQ